MNTYKGIGITSSRLNDAGDIAVRVYFTKDRNNKPLAQLCFYKDGVRKVKTKTLLSTNPKDQEAEAYQYKQDLQIQLYKEMFNTDKHLFKDELNIFINQHKRELKETSAIFFKEAYYLVERYFGEVYVEDIDSMDVDDFVNWSLSDGRKFHRDKLGTGLAQNTVKKALQRLKAFMSFERNIRHIIQFNPCDGIKLKDNSTTNQIDLSDSNTEAENRQYLTLDEVNLLINKFNDTRYKYPMVQIIHLAVHYGMRRGEILGLKWSDIDFKHDTFIIRNSIVKAAGQVVKQNSVKTKSSVRVYPFTDKIRADLKSLKEKQMRLGLYNENGYVFIKLKGSDAGETFDPGYITGLFKQGIKLTDEIKNKNLHFHSLRHTAVTLLYYEADFTLDQIARWVGHSSKYISDTYYLHDNLSWKEQKAAELNIELA